MPSSTCGCPLICWRKREKKRSTIPAKDTPVILLDEEAEAEDAVVEEAGKAVGKDVGEAEDEVEEDEEETEAVRRPCRLAGTFRTPTRPRT